LNEPLLGFCAPATYAAPPFSLQRSNNLRGNRGNIDPGILGGIAAHINCDEGRAQISE
jgi:hypothetical protein